MYNFNRGFETYKISGNNGFSLPRRRKGTKEHKENLVFLLVLVSSWQKAGLYC